MANSEDYLDSLLNSVQTVRKDVTDAQKQTEAILREKQEQRNRIKPDDDFMEASGIRDYKPEPTSHENLRKALSEDDFLKMFEEELGEDLDQSDDFIREFEDEIAQDELEYEKSFQEEASLEETPEEEISVPEETVTGEDTVEGPAEDQASDVQTSDEDRPADDTASFLDNIEEVVNKAKEQIEQGDDDLPALDGYGEDEMDAEFAEDKGEPDAEESIGEAGEDLLAKYLQMNDAEAADAEEPSLLDENDEDMDLMGLLSGDEDLDDIGALLQADGEDQPLEEAQETFEQLAEQTDPSADADPEGSPAEGDGAPVKKGLGALIDKIKSIFSKKDKEEDQVLDISQAPQEDLNQENLDILKELSEAEQKSKKAKKEKKPKKEKKTKEPKEKKVKVKKEKPPKSPKEPDNSPKIPAKVIVIFLVLAVSIVALITLAQHMMGYKLSLSDARTAYNAGDYFTSYEDLMGMDLKEADEDLFKKARLLGDLQKRDQEYQVFVKRQKYELALDSLVIGVARYEENLDEAKELGIEDEYTKLGDALAELLQDQYGVSSEDAVAMYQLNREDYSLRIDEIIASLHLDD